MDHIRRALKLLDVIYTTDNEGLKQSFEKLQTMAQLDDRTGEVGPFEQLYTNFEQLTWEVQVLKGDVFTLKQGKENPWGDHNYNSWLKQWLDSALTSSPFINNLNAQSSAIANDLSTVSSTVSSIISKLPKEEHEQELNSDAK